MGYNTAMNVDPEQISDTTTTLNIFICVCVGYEYFNYMYAT